MNRVFLDRVEGVFIIVNALLPAIIIAILSLSFYITYKSAEDALNDYIASIEQIIAEAKIAKREVEKAASDIAAMGVQIKRDGEEITRKVTKMTTSVTNTINNLSGNFANAVGKLALNVPIPVIKKDINIPFGKVLRTPMEKIGDAVAAPLRPMTESFSDIGDSVASIKNQVADLATALESLKYMEKYLDAVIVEYQKILQTVVELATIIGRLLMWLVFLSVLLVLWFGISYVLWVRRRVITGMALIRAT